MDVFFEILNIATLLLAAFALFAIAVDLGVSKAYFKRLDKLQISQITALAFISILCLACALYQFLKLNDFLV